MDYTVYYKTEKGELGTIKGSVAFPVDKDDYKNKIKNAVREELSLEAKETLTLQWVGGLRKNDFREYYVTSPKKLCKFPYDLDAEQTRNLILKKTEKEEKEKRENHRKGG